MVNLTSWLYVRIFNTLEMPFSIDMLVYIGLKSENDVILCCIFMLVSDTYLFGGIVDHNRKERRKLKKLG